MAIESKISMAKAVAAAIVLQGCGDREAIKMCREQAQLEIATPSTFKIVKESVEPVLLTEKPMIQDAGLNCKDFGWPDQLCARISQLDPVMMFGEKEKYRRIESEALRLASQVPASVRRAQRVSLEFDAANKFGAPIRYEADCIIKRAEAAKGKPLVLVRFDHLRGWDSD